MGVSFKTGFYSVGVGCLLAASAFAQQPIPGGQVKPGQSDVQGNSTQPGGVRNGQQNDQPRRIQREGQAVNASSNASEGQQGEKLNYAIAQCLLDNNKSEVDLAKMAVEHAKSDEVKKFAEQMVKDHTEMVDKLQKFVGSNESNDRRSQLDHKINERCAEAMQKELESKSGREFDAAYVGSQIGGHIHMLAALEVLSDETSGELQSIVKDAKPVVEKHYKHAKELMEKSDSRQASRDRGAERTE